MKIKKIMALKVLVVLALALGFTGCSKKETLKVVLLLLDGKSMIKGRIQFNDKFKQQETPPGMISIEGGTFTMGKVQDDVMHDWNNSQINNMYSLFFMDETEVTNKMYTEFLFWIKKKCIPSNR